ncbi:MAG: hypothetical protein KF855_14945 [Acidobacteria bacterium]|nr:hypothetical protein [Acidobacteriota bacterium]
MKHFAVKLLIAVMVASAVVVSYGQARLPESTIKTVYLVPFSHYDFGFVEPPDAVRERAARHIDEVIRVAEEDPNFKWTIESVWQVNEWLKRQRKPSSVLPKDKEKIERLMKLIRSGRVALSSAWGSMHTDFMGGEELNRLIYDYTALSKAYDIKTELAMLNDVPGHPTTMPGVLAGSGMKYMVTGANTFLMNATDIAPGKVPFYWEGPDGSKILTWISQGNRGAYVEAATEFYLDPFSHDPYTDRRPFEMFNSELIGKTTPIQEMELGMTKLLNRYNEGGYKYDAVMVLAAHDFVEPTDVLNLEKAITLWKQHHPEIELKIATPPEFFKYIESKYGDHIPTFKGEWSGLWSEAKTQSPQVSASARYVHDHAPAAETMWSALAMTRKLTAPVGNIASIFDLILTYDEHSGAGNNGWPQLNSRKPLEDQNQQYVDMMGRAVKETDRLFDEGVKAMAQATRHEVPPQQPFITRPFLVYNGLSWKRSDVVRIAPPKGRRITGVLSRDGQNIEFDTDKDGMTVFVATDVPAMGYSTYNIRTEVGDPVISLRQVRGRTLSFGGHTVIANDDGTIASIKDGSGRELVNKNGELPFNELLRVEGNDASKIVYPEPAGIRIDHGIQMAEMTITRGRSAFPETRIRIYKNLDRLELQNILDRDKFPFVGGSGNWSDAYYFAFPFNVSTDGMKVIRGGQKWFDMLPDDYMDGARKDSVTTRHSIGFTNGKSTAIVAHRQAFHWSFPSYVSTRIRAKDAPAEFPAMYTGKFPLPEATIYSRAIRHSDQADTHDMAAVNLATVEPGLGNKLVFDYAFAADGAFDPVKSWRFGNEINLPFKAGFITSLPVIGEQGFFGIDQPNVQIVTVKPLAESSVRGEVSSAPLQPKQNKIFIIRLQEFAGRAATAKVSLPVRIKRAVVVSLTEDRELQPVTQIEPLTVSIRPYQTLTVKIEVE